MGDEFKDECGVFGLSLRDRSDDMIRHMFLGLFSLQHRGQESCGISYETDDGIEVVKSRGLVSGDFLENLPKNVSSKIAVGHVRYATCGASNLINAQPLIFKSNKGDVAIAHNGNLPNSERLKRDLLHKGAIFQTTSDSEILIHLMSMLPGSDFETSLIDSLKTLEGAYAMLVMSNDKLIAFRDPQGFRPLSYGFINEGVVFSSETAALTIIGAHDITTVKPGELIVCSNGSIIKKIDLSGGQKPAQCVFELIYFARPDSVVFDEAVYQFRLRVGRKLAQNRHKDTDLVIPVPDSGNVSALGFSRESGIPFDLSLMRNHYTGRTFIKPGQQLREDSVKMKLNPVATEIRGKTLSIIDDSLVRGTTSKKIVKMLREAGAKEVHVYLASPEIIGSCYYGINTPTTDELISAQNKPMEIAKIIGADSVTFLSVADLKECLTDSNAFCYACFNREYPTTIDELSCKGCF